MEVISSIMQDREEDPRPIPDNLAASRRPRGEGGSSEQAIETPDILDPKATAGGNEVPAWSEDEEATPQCHDPTQPVSQPVSQPAGDTAADPEDMQDLMYQIILRRGEDKSSVNIAWHYPPGNPRDNSAWVGLYHAAKWEYVELPCAKPDLKGRIGYKYLSLNACHGELTFPIPVSYTHLRAHETPEHLVCRLLLEKKKKIRAMRSFTHQILYRKKYSKSVKDICG
eukprot:TRINITY_DN5330_c0_g1_i3.p1 TRINITY_DN5330_c0_g1~~TRINITY_DN5330_c0_g1_i3.p1  ORF type:complete len:226 (-),score=33.00 TRINITY_DN5330_c0_g1_i3:48-725(-)